MHEPPEWMLCYWETRTRLILTALMTGLSSPRRIAHIANGRWACMLLKVSFIVYPSFRQGSNEGDLEAHKAIPCGINVCLPAKHDQYS